ncbi:Transcription elongation protein nusA [Porphyromonas cangingivalis]|uniref:Transcription termination/antitermination protein NusA n=2 Tax=Porphyromonas cangingivalis TaxID=36874 RepID=A0A1T4M9B6_PORCN|nr:NusA antitermination factor [Porphyromonas cangingivalis]VEJ02395.1 Transcription elongation protein nusA [Porphyromonas cangingivalis]
MIESFSEFKSLKNIDKETLVKVLEESFRNVIAKMFGTDSNFDVIINPDKGDLEIWRRRIVVEDGEVENPMQQISLSEVNENEEDFDLGEEYVDRVYFEDFGRRAILNLRQTLSSKILELQKDSLYAYYSQKVGELIVAEVYQVWKKEVLLLDYDGNELILPRNLMIPRDRFRKGDSIRAIIDRVEYNNNNPKIILSRVSNEFLMRLFELEVPEINDGLISIKKVARIPGERAKIAVESYDERIDPIGACVGMRGSRIHGVVRELHNENIDVVHYTSNLQLFIQRALSPAKVSSIKIIEETKHAEVLLRQDQISLAIGKGGNNIKLASLLTGYEIEVFRDEADTVDEEDIYLDEFDDEIDVWVINTFKSIGCDTAKAVLRKSREELIRATDLEESTIDHVLEVLRAEFEDEEELQEEVPVEPMDNDEDETLEER